MKKADVAVLLTATLIVAGTGIADARPSGGRGSSGGHGGGHGYSGARGGSLSHGHYGHSGHYYRPYYGGRVVVGVPYYGYPYYTYPAYYDPVPAYYPPASPPAYYYEQQSAPEAQGDWFYCTLSRAYYPQVQDCPGGWQRVAPRP